MKKFILLALVASLGAANAAAAETPVRQWLFGHRLLPIMLEGTSTTVGDDGDPADGPH